MTQGLELQNVSGESLSIYGQKFSEWSAKSNWIVQKVQDTNWLGRKYSQELMRMTMTGGTIQDVEYEGHQILVIGYHWAYQYYLDKNGVRVADIAEIGNPTSNPTLEPEIHQVSNFYAMGYRHSDAHHDLEWCGQDALFSMVYTSNSSKSTLKKAMKRIDLENKILAVRDELIAIANTKWNNGFTNFQDNQFAPYNAVIGDKVFVQAHGRLRQGIIVDTSGSKFVVGYVTPSNHYEMKYKTLPLSLMYAVPTP